MFTELLGSRVQPIKLPDVSVDGDICYEVIPRFCGPLPFRRSFLRSFYPLARILDLIAEE